MEDEIKIYHGEDILKMLREGKLKVGTKIESNNLNTCIVDITFQGEYFIMQKEQEPIPICNLIYDEFIIMEDESC